MGPDRDRTRDPWICSQTCICSQTRYRLRYAARKLVSEKLCLKTKVVPMHVLMNAQRKAPDVVDIFAFYQTLISESCIAAGKDIGGYLVHVGDDQLTRERFT